MALFKATFQKLGVFRMAVRNATEEAAGAAYC